MTREFVELPTFLEDWKRLGLTDAALRQLEAELLLAPQTGDVIVGTGGLRKMRMPLPGRGKRGGARVIYVDFAVYEKIYLLAAYTKNEQQNLTAHERMELARLVGQLEKELERKMQRGNI